MNKLYVTFGVLGLGGLGMLLLTDKGRQTLRLAVEKMHFGSGKLAEWNQAAQSELDRIQSALDQLTQSLQAADSEAVAGS